MALAQKCLVVFLLFVWHGDGGEHALLGVLSELAAVKPVGLGQVSRDEECDLEQIAFKTPAPALTAQVNCAYAYAAASHADAWLAEHFQKQNALGRDQISRWVRTHKRRLPGGCPVVAEM
ncbi:hypothetical protein [Desulfocurvibacter africanus]|uniref:hypothetical protein n=1 Tax=Desulfocurvibacter africanus TaxID=873 RepID=UPI001183B20E|nr:hypothetical protein [Desulfocurvibacter africanus]